jgi:hypothetical protein
VGLSRSISKRLVNEETPGSGILYWLGRYPRPQELIRIDIQARESQSDDRREQEPENRISYHLHIATLIFHRYL